MRALVATAAALAGILLFLLASASAKTSIFARNFQILLGLNGAVAVMLLGLVAKNSILLVDLAMEKIRHGAGRKQALIEAGTARLRPILMTSLALLFGTLPLAIALNEAGRFRSSMGVAIVGGLATSTLLTLVAVPAAFEYIDDLRQWIEGFIKRLGQRD